MNIEMLYPLVTEAILRAEELERLGVPGYRSAYHDVSLLEEQITNVLPASNVEGAIARRGAVRASIAAHQFPRAMELIDRFSAEAEMDASLKKDLNELAQELKQPQYENFVNLKAIRKYDTQAISMNLDP